MRTRSVSLDVVLLRQASVSYHPMHQLCSCALANAEGMSAPIPGVQTLEICCLVIQGP